MISRRQILAAAGLTYCGALGSTLLQAASPCDAALPGLQLASFRDLMRADPGRLFARVAKLGIRRVELAGTHGHSGKKLRQLLDAAGIGCTSIHVEAADDALTLAAPRAVIDLADTLGASNVVMPIFLYPEGAAAPQGPNAMEMVRAAGRGMREPDYLRNAQFLNRVGEALAKGGKRLSYHNHNVELAPIEGGCGLEILVRETDPDLVGFQLDIGWIAAAGANPVTWISRLGSRLASMHLKDVSNDLPANSDLRYRYAPWGGGRINWREVLRSAGPSMLKKSFVEIEGVNGAQAWLSLQENLARLRLWRAGADDEN
ncbi:MAG: sugar phosphate isomerase/epimerase [Sphingopyxis sp.]|nr:sugar phosphate isomerase/epimerase [Sphingopyxis sp.]